MKNLGFGVLGMIVALAACGPSVPATFAAPADEISRVEKAADATCKEQRVGYWFCQSEGGGFVHVYTAVPKGSTQVIVSHVMLEGDDDLNGDVAALYGFSSDDLAAAIQGGPGGSPIVRGGFELLVDPTWKDLLIRVHAAN